MSGIVKQDLLYKLCSQIKEQKNIIVYVNNEIAKLRTDDTTKYYFILYTCIYIYSDFSAIKSIYDYDFFKTIVNLLDNKHEKFEEIITYFVFQMQGTFSEKEHAIRLERFIILIDLLDTSKSNLFTQFLTRKGNIKKWLYDCDYRYFDVNDKTLTIRPNNVISGNKKYNYYIFFLVPIIQSYYTNEEKSENGYSFLKNEFTPTIYLENKNIKDSLLSRIYPNFHIMTIISRELSFNDTVYYYDDTNAYFIVIYPENNEKNKETILDIEKYGAIKDFYIMLFSELEKNKKIDFNAYLNGKNIFFYIIDAFFNNIRIISRNKNKYTEIHNDNNDNFLSSIELVVKNYREENKTFILNTDPKKTSPTVSIFEYILKKYSENIDNIKKFEKIQFNSLFEFFYNSKDRSILNKIFSIIKTPDINTDLLTVLESKKYKRIVGINYYKFYVKSLINFEFILFISNWFIPYFSLKEEINSKTVEGSSNIKFDSIQIVCDYISKKDENIIKNGVGYHLNKQKYFSYSVIFDKTYYDSNYNDTIFETFISTFNPTENQPYVEKFNLILIFNDEILCYGTEFIVFIDETFTKLSSDEYLNIIKIDTETETNIKIIMSSNIERLKDLPETDEDMLYNYFLYSYNSEYVYKTINNSSVVLSIERIKNPNIIYYEKIISDMIFLRTCIDMGYNYREIKQKYETFMLYNFITEPDNEFIINFNNGNIIDFDDEKTRNYINLYNSIDNESFYNFKKINIPMIERHISIVKNKKINEYNQKLEEYMIDKDKYTTMHIKDNAIKEIKEITQSKFEIIEDLKIIDKIKAKFNIESSDFLYPYILYGIGVINKHLKINNIGYLIIHGGSAVKYYNNLYNGEGGNDVDVKFFPNNTDMTENDQKIILEGYYNKLVEFLELKYKSNTQSYEDTRQPKRRNLIEIEHPELYETEMRTKSNKKYFKYDFTQDKIIKLKLNSKSIFETYLFNKDDPYFTLYKEILDKRNFTKTGKIDDISEIPDANMFEDTNLLFLNKELLIIELLIKIHSPDKIITSSTDSRESLYNYIQNKAINQINVLIKDYIDIKNPVLIETLTNKTDTIKNIFNNILEFYRSIVSDGKNKNYILKSKKLSKRRSKRRSRHRSRQKKSSRRSRHRSRQKKSSRRSRHRSRQKKSSRRSRHRSRQKKSSRSSRQRSKRRSMIF
jgi:hypothetical protein